MNTTLLPHALVLTAIAAIALIAVVPALYLWTCLSYRTALRKTRDSALANTRGVYVTKCEYAPFADRDWYYTKSNLHWNSTETSSAIQVDILPGFATDMASIPWGFHWIFPPDGPYKDAAVVHDWLYWEQSTTRDNADSCLREAMNDSGVAGVQQKLFFWAVSTFGRFAWKHNAQDRKAGYRRVVPSEYFPLPTTTKWKDLRESLRVPAS